MGRPKQSKEQLKLSGMDKAHPGRYESMANTPDAVLLSTLSCPTRYRPETKRAWDQVVPMLVNMGIVSEQDIPEITLMFRFYDTCIYCDEKLRETIENEANYEDESQYQTAFERWNNQRLKTWNSCQALMGKFGISPAERAKLVLPEKKKESPIEQMIRMAAQ